MEDDEEKREGRMATTMRTIGTMKRRRKTAEKDPSTRHSTLFATTGGILCQLRTGSNAERNKY
jgi:hypothetical protein